MKPTTELKPCPFCHGRDLRLTERFNASRVTCKSCGATISQSHMGQGDAAERWNNRPAESCMQSALEEIEQSTDLRAYMNGAAKVGSPNAVQYVHQMLATNALEAVKGDA